MAVYEYGPGREYLTPQLAVDALFTAVGENPFTEIHYIRGFEGSYFSLSGVGSPYVVHIPSFESSAQFPLIFDVNEGDKVEWYTAIGTDIPIKFDSLVHDITVKFENIIFSGDAPQLWVTPHLGKLSTLEFIDCVIGNLDDIENTGFTILGEIDEVTNLFFTRTKAATQEHCLTTYDPVATINGMFAFNNSILATVGEGYSVMHGYLGGAAILLVIHSLLQTVDSPVFYDTRPSGQHTVIMVIMANIFNITTSEAPIFKYDTSAIAFFTSVLACDYNCFNRAGAVTGYFAVIQETGLSFDEFKTITLSNYNSFEADPLLDSDFMLQEDSPCLKSGKTIGADSINGYERAFGRIDIGPIQVSYITSGYTTPDAVIDYTGVTYDDLGRSSNALLVSLLSEWITDATQYINNYVGTSWVYGQQPGGISNACMRIVAGMVFYSIQKRKSPVVQIGDFNLKMIEDAIITGEVKDMLNSYIVKKKITQGKIFALGVSKKEDDDDEEEYL